MQKGRQRSEFLALVAYAVSRSELGVLALWAADQQGGYASLSLSQKKKGMHIVCTQTLRATTIYVVYY